ncbi:MAG: phosphatidate cytidylyltransferase [Proteobacteria bacterium]|nr:phosphatidate cytidylyltransferase [Pseudomonadota bacterium]
MIVGLGGLAVLLPALIWGGELAVQIIGAIAVLVCAEEFASMAFKEDKWAAFGWLSLTAGSSHLALVHLGTDVVGWLFPMIVVATMAFVMLRPGPSLEAAADRVGRYVLGQVWIGFFLASLVILRGFDFGLGWVFVVLAVAWCGDTGAYFAGRSLGKHKLYERVSPKKTWEGFFGGLAGGVGGLFAVRAIGATYGWTDLTPLDCVVLGVALGSAAVAGDLSESLMKRAFKVKDSGWIMPGHGGLLDRIDSVVFVAPLLVGYLRVIKGIG